MEKNKNMQKDILKLFSLNNKVAIVTGAAKGNGRAIAEGFLSVGAIVYLVDILEKELNKVEKSINNPKARFLTADVGNKNDLSKVVNHIIKERKRIDILVNNAGITIGGPSESYKEEDWEETYKINLKAPFLLSQLVSKQMIKQKQGVIINITSLGAEQGFSNNPGYVASKGGLKQLTKALAKDWAKYNIRVNNLGPGYIKTDMTTKSWKNLKLRKERNDRIMLERWGDPDSLVGPTIFLASNALNYITGQDLYVDGGWLAKGI